MRELQVCDMGAGSVGAVEGDGVRVFGYARVSSADQNLDRQLDALLEWGVPAGRIYEDKASGKNFERPGWQCLAGKLASGDILVVKSIDRLGRNYNEIIDQWRWLTKERGVQVVVLDMPLLDTRQGCDNLTGAFIADLVLQLLSYVAQVERENICARQAEGIRAAKSRGVHMGRPPKVKPSIYPQVRAQYLAGVITHGEAARQLGCGVSTFDKWLREGPSRSKGAA